jgi:beta-glucanase (GH16 family)
MISTCHPERRRIAPKSKERSSQQKQTASPQLKLVLITALLTISACAAPTTYGANLADLPQAPAAPTSVATATKLVFHDEFSGTSLNAKIWYRCFNWANERTGCKTNPGELEVYHTGNVTVANGHLNLTAKHETSTYRGKTYDFTSGIIQTGGWPKNGSTPTFSYQYGYSEVRAKLPSGSVGMWPSFWLLPADNSWPPEVDIMEWQGVTPAEDQVTLWWKLPNGNAARVYNTGASLAAAYHTYGFDWQSTYADFYFDRRRIMHYAGPNVPQKAMFVLINLAVGGWEKGQLKPPLSEFPTTYSVDYVRVWNKRPF